MRTRHLFGAALLALALPISAAAQQPAAQPSLTYEMARTAAEAAEAEARANDWNVTILVVDSAAVPVYLKRLTGASPRSYEFAAGKARTVIASGVSTREYIDRVAAGTMQAIPDATSIEGGLPIVVDGRVVGAIAASGVRAVQDAQISQAGIDAISR